MPPSPAARRHRALHGYSNFQVQPDDPFEGEDMFAPDGTPRYRLRWIVEYRNDGSVPAPNPIPLLVPSGHRDLDPKLPLGAQVRPIVWFEHRVFNLMRPGTKDWEDYRELQNRIAAGWYSAFSSEKRRDGELYVSWFRRYYYLRINDYRNPSQFQVHGMRPARPRPREGEFYDPLGRS